LQNHFFFFLVCRYSVISYFSLSIIQACFHCLSSSIVHSYLLLHCRRHLTENNIPSPSKIRFPQAPEMPSFIPHAPVLPLFFPLYMDLSFELSNFPLSSLFFFFLLHFCLVLFSPILYSLPQMTSPDTFHVVSNIYICVFSFSPPM
jgi:hypothetical protein